MISSPPVRTVVERSAGGVLARSLKGEWQVLLIGTADGRWSLPKGHVEGGETLREAAAREVEEETGVRPGAVGPKIGTADWLFVKKGKRVHKYCTYFLMRAGRGRPVPQVSEGITHCRWLAVDEAARTVSFANTRQVVEDVPAAIERAGW